jgi:sialidase-1
MAMNELFSLNLTPWSSVHPRNDHQLIFPLSDDRLMFVWCEYYQRKPSLVFRSAYAEKGSMDDAPCQVSAKISRDRGRTWSGRFTLQENRGVDNVKHPNLLRLPSGEILFSFTERDLRNQDLRVYIKRSSDECETWGPIEQISPTGGVYFTNADHILQHSSGRIILPCHAGPIYGRGNHWKAFCFYSDDDGRTWEQSREKADLPQQGAEEPGVVERPDGSLFAVLRSTLGKLYATVSEDRGETWSAPESTGLDSPAVANCLKTIPGSDHLLLLWNNALPYGLREGAAEQGITTLHWPRNPLCSAISKDGGETWGSIRFVENRTGYNNGYPSATFLDDEVFVTWYSCSESTDWSAEVMLKIFSKGWFYGEGT